jgi:hypothetical protein
VVSPEKAPTSIADIQAPILAILAARTILSALGIVLWVAGRVPTTADALARPYFGTAPVTDGLAGALLGVWQRFDAIHYVRIAITGYSAADLSVFFPLFPLLVRGSGKLLGIDHLFASVLVSNLAAVLAVTVFHRLVMDERRDHQLARKATLYLVFFPTAFFLLAPYTESLALLLSLLAFRQARRGRWWSAGVAGLAGALARAQGVLIIVVFIAELARRLKDGTRVGLAAAFAILAPLIGLFSFAAWRASVGFPALSSVQLEYWNRVTRIPFSVVIATLGRMAMKQASFIEYVDLAIVAVMLALGVLVLKRLPASYSVYFWTIMLFNLAQVRLTQPISSQGRFALALFPAFIVLGELGASPRINRLILYPCVAAWLFLAGQFIMWGWVG